MPQQIIVCTAYQGIDIWLKSFLARNHDTLAAQGVLPVGVRDAASIAHGLDYNNDFGNDSSAYAKLLRSWADEHNSAHTWIMPLSVRHFLPEVFLQQLTLCRIVFPKVKITWVHGLTRVVPTYCMDYSMHLFQYPAFFPVLCWVNRRIRITESQNMVHTIFRPGKPGPEAIFMAQGDDPEAMTRLMLHRIGVLADTWPEQTLDYAPPVLPAPLARDSCAYILALKTLFSRFGGPAFSWNDEAGVLQGGEDPACVLSPEECAYITQATRANYEAVARVHKLPLLPDYVPEPGWQPFPGLCRETVSRMMDLHTPDCAANIRVFLAGLNPRLLTSHECDIFADFLPRQGVSVAAALEEGESFRPKVSVLTPTYNHAAYIKDCIEGVIAQQTSFPIEHVIADDGSDDGTWEIIQDYASRYPHIVPVGHAQHVGIYGNQRDLYQMARAPYVALCDGDDYFTDPLKLQTQAELLDAKPSLGLCFHLTTVYYQNTLHEDWTHPPLAALPGGVRPRYSLEDLLHRNLMQTSSVMYRWLFGPVLPDWLALNVLPSDWYLHIIHAEQGAIGFINKVMSVYRRHKNALYYTSEVSLLEHRRKYGFEELYTYDVINRHFKGKYKTIMYDRASNVFFNLMLDFEKRQDDRLLVKATRIFPEFAEYTLKCLKSRQV